MTAKQALTDFKDYCSNLAKKHDIKLPENFFLYTAMLCWKCKKPMLVFVWPDAAMWESDAESQNIIIEHPQCPKSIQMRYGKAVGSSYIANICLSCDTLTGDWYIKAEPGSPLFSVYYEKEDDFENCLSQAATIWASNNGISYDGLNT